MPRVETQKWGSTPQEQTRGRQAQRPNAEQLQREIEQEAYRLFESRGREEGHALEDWVRAERTVRRRWNVSS